MSNAVEEQSIDVLDHAGLRWLIARLRTARTDPIAPFLFDEFAEALRTHLEMVDRLLLPTLQELGGNEILQYIDRHWYLKRSLLDVCSMDRHAAAFHKRLVAICDRLEGQMMWEAVEWTSLRRGDVRAPYRHPRPPE